MADTTNERTGINSEPTSREQSTSDAVIESTVSISVEPGTSEPGTSDSNHREKRGRGRPPKVVINGEETPPTKTRSRKAKTIGQEKAKEIVSLLVPITELTVSAALKLDASFAPAERSFIEPALVNIIADMQPKSYELASKFINPIMLFTGLMLWGTRLYNEVNTKEVSTENFQETNHNIKEHSITDILEQNWNGQS